MKVNSLKPGGLYAIVQNPKLVVIHTAQKNRDYLDLRMAKAPIFTSYRGSKPGLKGQPALYLGPFKVKMRQETYKQGWSKLHVFIIASTKYFVYGDSIRHIVPLGAGQ